MTHLDDHDAPHVTHEAGATPGADETLMEAIIAAIRTVHDPEIPVNVYDLGLIYRIDVLPGGHVEIDMTLTAPGCPVAGELLSWVEKAVVGVEGISGATIKLVFDPPWENSRMSEDVQLELGLL
ncbi:DUF59 domain-containing protein [Roseixanthobacter pseudopolyaromaticivorans]|uniref:DUF59 domain-containing protein n=1 Tax=Xanthobacteraceae TaxID=335928 RepID=UPI00372D6C4C